jgi:hypothetical protein
VFHYLHQQRMHQKMRLLTIVVPLSGKSASINEVIYCLPQQRMHQWMTWFFASINKECINEWCDFLPPSTKSASINEVICCLHQWWVHQ